MATGLSASARKKAEEELNEKPGRREQDIELLRNLVTSNKALTCRTDAAWLVRYLRARKFDVQRANQLIINYFTIRSEYADRFADLRPSAVKHVYDCGACLVLPHRDKLGRRILYLRMGSWDPKAFPIWDVLRAMTLNFEKIVDEEETQINGVVAIGNFANSGWDHAKAMDRDYGKVLTKVMQEAFPLRFKGMFIVNEPGIFDFIMALIRPFMSAKMLGRINVIGSDLNKLHQLFDPAILPEELGGDLAHGDSLAKDWSAQMMRCEQQMSELSRYGIQTLKPIMKGSGSGSDSTGGVSGGTFRRLNVD